MVKFVLVESPESLRQKLENSVLSACPP